MRFKLIMTTVKTDVTDCVVDAAKKAGATGATIIPARGTGIHEAKTFFSLTLEAQTDLVMFLLEEHLVEAVMKAIYEAGFNPPSSRTLQEAWDRYRFRIAGGPSCWLGKPDGAFQGRGSRRVLLNS